MGTHNINFLMVPVGVVGPLTKYQLSVTKTFIKFIVNAELAYVLLLLWSMLPCPGSHTKLKHKILAAILKCSTNTYAKLLFPVMSLIITNLGKLALRRFRCWQCYSEVVLFIEVVVSSRSERVGATVVGT